MTSPYESVEIVEVTWKIPNFDLYIPSGISGLSYKTFRKVVFIGGRVPRAYPQSKSPPVKLRVSVSKDIQVAPAVSLGDRPGSSAKWLLSFVIVSDRSLPASPCSLYGKLMELKTLHCENTLVTGMKGGGDTRLIDFSVKEKHHDVILFDHSDADGYMDNKDESLKIYFKLEITCYLPELLRDDLMTGEFAELSNDFESLLKDPQNADVEIKISVEETRDGEIVGDGDEEEDKYGGEKGGGHSFQCHKMILAVRSPVFRAMFSSDMKETKKNVVEVDDILPKTMEHFLSFLYCGRFQDSSWIQSLPQLAYVADKYDVKSLRNLCDSHLIRSVTLGNALSIGSIAEQHGLTKATRDIREFIAANVFQVTLNSNVNKSKCDPDFNVTYRIP